MEIIRLISTGIGLVGIAVIVWGVLLILCRLLRLELARIERKSIFVRREALRHQLGSYMLLGLEFLIAADIIRTVMHPTLIDMALLGSVVVIRTLISFFLDREIEEFRPSDAKA